jgi:hypothetical protein
MYELYLLKEYRRDFDGDIHRADVELLKYRREQDIEEDYRRG